MAYNSRVTGEWRIDPPLDGRALRDLPEFEWIKVRVSEDVKHLDDGSFVTHRWGVAIEPAQEGEWSYYTLPEDLAKLLVSIPMSARVTGHLVRAGEEQGDVERYSVNDTGQVVTERAELRWPDGTDVD